MAPTPAYQRPRGTQDVLPEAARTWRRLEALIANHSESFGFGELRTPLFEETELFSRTSGASSDVVRKEMYTFLDRGGRSLTLRPEGTASAARAYLENGLASVPQPVKLWYLGPMFRYDRPQAGRFRQHTQYGIEIFGAEGPLADAEVILVARDLFERLGLFNLVVHLNSIGCPACRPAYREKLVAYFATHVDEMCDDCRERFRHNPLRIFDCKREGCRALLVQAPLSAENLCPDCDRHLARVKEALTALGIRYVDDPRLVRGLDYYNRTVFEIIYEPRGGGGQGGATRGEAAAGGKATGGAERVLCGGGRYDGLVEELGGQPTPGVGFGMGLERLLATLESEGLTVPEPACPRSGSVLVAAAGEAAELEGFKLARCLRRDGFVAVTDLLGRSLKAQFKAADRFGARWVIVLGEDELSRGVAAVRDLASGDQKEVAADKIAEVLEG